MHSLQQPAYMLSGFSGHPDTLKRMVEAAQGPRGEQSMRVRTRVEEITHGLQGKDYLGELLAIRYWVTENVRYINDSLHVEIVKDPERLIEEVDGYGIGSGDCDDIATLIGAMHLCLGRVAKFFVVGFGAPGAYSHVFEGAIEPRSEQTIICDPVAGTDERGMLERVSTYYTVSLDEPPGHGMRY